MLILKEIGVTYLGTAYQITDKYGFYAGNEKYMMSLNKSLMQEEKLWKMV